MSNKSTSLRTDFNFDLNSLHTEEQGREAVAMMTQNGLPSIVEQNADRQSWLRLLATVAAEGAAVAEAGRTRVRGTLLNPTDASERWCFVSRSPSCGWEPLRRRSCAHAGGTISANQPPLGIDDQQCVITRRFVISISALDNA